MPQNQASIQAARVFAPSQVLLPGLSYQSFVYPGDEEALKSLSSIPGAAPLLTYLNRHFSEELIYVQNNEYMVRAGRDNYASLYRLLERCAEILSLPVPELDVSTNPVLNAYTVGQRRTAIVLHSALIESLTVDELSFVIGHELGHIKCAHGLYRMLGDVLIRYWDMAASMIPVPGLALLRIPLLLAYWEWFRRAELTCDRAGLLCVQHLDSGMSALAKLAGKAAGFENEFNPAAVMRQEEARAEVKNKLMVAIAILEAAQNTHPFIPVRLRALAEFAESRTYRAILAGRYHMDPLGKHEGGRRIRCECNISVNMKLNYCPQCGRALAKPAA